MGFEGLVRIWIGGIWGIWRVFWERSSICIIIEVENGLRIDEVILGWLRVGVFVGCGDA